jgi:hypothetical protein
MLCRRQISCSGSRYIGPEAVFFPEPLEHIVSVPADLPATKPSLPGEAPEQSKRREDPLRAPGQARNVMGSENLLARWKTFIDPPRE